MSSLSVLMLCSLFCFGVVNEVQISSIFVLFPSSPHLLTPDSHTCAVKTLDCFLPPCQVIL